MIAAAAPQHVAHVVDELIDDLTAAELEMLTAIGDQVHDRLAALDQVSEHAG